MDVVLNELSLSGQFENDNLFLSNLSEVVKMTHLINKIENISLLKSNTIWNSKITTSDTLLLLLRKKGSDLLNKLRLDLSKMSANPPYWEETQVHSCVEDSYEYSHNDICNTGLAESSQRDKVVISFEHFLYSSENIKVMKNSTEINIKNILNLKLFSQYLYDKSLINEYEFCNYFFHNTKLSFTKLDNEKRGFNFLTQEQKKLYIGQFKLFAEMSWEDIVSSDGIEYKKYQNTLSGFREVEIYKFRISQKYRCFGYRKGEIFYIVHFEVDHKLSDNG